jgi:hypothetical protein
LLGEAIDPRPSPTSPSSTRNSVVVEPNFGDGMFNELLKPVLQREGYPCEVIDTESSAAQKERRIIDTMEPVLNQHKLNKSLIPKDYRSTENLPSEEINRYRLFYQLTRITKDKGSLVNDDRIDAVALGVHYWTEAMARDAKREELRYRDQMMWNAPPLARGDILVPYRR